MFGTKKEVKAEENAAKTEYVVKVLEVRTTEDDSAVMMDLDINGVQIKSCTLKEVVCKKDGEVHKKGDICYIVNFPSRKAKNNKYYNIVWCPLSNDHIEDIVKQVQSLLS